MTWTIQDEINYAEAAGPETDWDFYDIRELKRQKLWKYTDDNNNNNKIEKKQTESNINNVVIDKTS